MICRWRISSHLRASRPHRFPDSNHRSTGTACRCPIHVCSVMPAVRRRCRADRHGGIHDHCPYPARERRNRSVVFERWRNQSCPVPEKEANRFSATKKMSRIGGAGDHFACSRIGPIALHRAGKPKPKHSNAGIVEHSSGRHRVEENTGTIVPFASIRNTSIGHQGTGSTPVAARWRQSGPHSAAMVNRSSCTGVWDVARCAIAGLPRTITR